MAWSTPKTDWASSDGIGTTDMNRIEGNIADIRFKGGTNGRIGTASFANEETSAVSNTSVTANTLIFLTCNSLTGSGSGAFHVSAKTAGSGFTISAPPGTTVTASVAYMLCEPQ